MKSIHSTLKKLKKFIIHHNDSSSSMNNNGNTKIIKSFDFDFDDITIQNNNTNNDRINDIIRQETPEPSNNMDIIDSSTDSNSDSINSDSINDMDITMFIDYDSERNDVINEIEGNH
mmetsp:Transcript_14232/g.17486  ORF Transcript_14232/g.17486 Transcript_14232/m.17486 type:complete len:117 (+) Transcript_14232:127-477(+)